MNITRYTADPVNTTFLYPKSRQYPFDEVCEKIVRALEKRNWKVPGIQVEFDDFVTEGLRYRQVSKINGKDFKLCFSRFQGVINQWLNDLGAIQKMVIPRKKLYVYENETGPTFYTYVGNDWEKDKDAFMNELKFFSKLVGDSKTYLKYTGRCDPLDENGCHPNQRNSYLVNDDDSGKDYKACGDEPKYFYTDQVFKEINDWLNVNVLETIEAVE